jgi:hypothetical protein
MIASTMNTALVPAAAEKKSWASMVIDRTRAEMANAPSVPLATYARAAGSVVVGHIEGAVVGSTLGALHGRFGLDTPAGPIDGWLAAAGGVAGVVLAGIMPEVASHAATMGGQAFAVFTFRRVAELVNHGPLPGGVQRIAAPRPGVAIAGDPIEEAARRL